MPISSIQVDPCLQVEKSDYDLETAMGLYGFTDFELMWERTMDTKYDSPRQTANPHCYAMLDVHVVVHRT